jgi:hypothetical protein
MMTKDAVRWNIDIAASRMASTYLLESAHPLMQINQKPLTAAGRGIFGPPRMCSGVVGKNLMMSLRGKRALSVVLGTFGILVVVTAATQPSAREADGGRRIVSAQKEGQLCISAMTPEEFHAAYPQLLSWIQKTLGDYQNIAQPVASMQFARLPHYFDQSLLETVKFIAIERLPLPPLTAMGLNRFATFEQGNFDGITYLDRYFIKRTVVTEEALHFHELIHVIQWRLLGPERFLSAYVNGLDEFGYENSPLEKMAYDAEALFKQSSIFDAEKFVAERLGCL